MWKSQHLDRITQEQVFNYVTGFKNHHLVAKGGNMESKLKWRLTVDCWYNRMAICNEFDMSAEDMGSSDKSGNKMRNAKNSDKTTMTARVSDGDTITCRV
jgi:hypothetical protein